jgi:hypothetical protein
MTAAIRIIGVCAAIAWGLLFAVMLFLTIASGPPANFQTVAFPVVPAIVAAAALWVALRIGLRNTKKALLVELLLLGAGATCLLVVAAASGG